MGLPMWKDPDETRIEDVAAKLDRATARQRTSIRREPTVRPPRTNTTNTTNTNIASSTTGLGNVIRSRHQNGMDLSPRTRNDRESEAHISLLEAELERLRRIRVRAQALTQDHFSTRSQEPAHPPTTAAPDHLRLTPDESNASLDDEQMGDAGAGAATDTDVAGDISIHLPRPSRESNLRYEFLPARPDLPTSGIRFVTEDADGRDRTVPDGPLEPWITPPPLSADFAPARAAREALSRSEGTSTPHEPISAAATTTASGDRRGLETPPPETWENSYPALRRVPHMSPRPLPRTDGLGDRRRSPSPFSEALEEDTWAHLLTTMASGRRIGGDSGRSSTATSFASNLDSHSNVSSARSSQNTQTSATTSFGEIGSTDNPCDLDLPPGITADDVREARERHRRDRGGRRNGDRERERDRRRQRDLEFLLDRERNQDRNRDLDGPATPTSVEGAESGTSSEPGPFSARLPNRRIELGLLHAILERMHRREEVPDDWWAMVGLPPDFGRERLES